VHADNTPGLCLGEMRAKDLRFAQYVGSKEKFSQNDAKHHQFD
jgi:hypothetical protein